MASGRVIDKNPPRHFELHGFASAMQNCSRDDPLQRRFERSATSAVNSSMMPPKLAEFNGDEVTMFGLRLMKSFLKLRSRERREVLIALAERMVEEETEYSAKSGE